MALRDIALAELTGGLLHIAHMSARQTLDAVRYGKSRGARVTCEVTPHHFVLTDEMLGGADRLRHERQDEPAAARGGRTATRCSRASPTAASTSSRPITRRTTHDEKHVEFDRAPFGITGPRDRRCRSASIASSTPASFSLSRLGGAAVGEPGADPRRARRIARRGRAGRHHDPRAGPARHRSRRRRCASLSKNTPFDGWTAARRRRGDHRRRPRGLLRTSQRISAFEDRWQRDWIKRDRSIRREGAEGPAAVGGPDDRRALRLRQRLSRRAYT